MTDRPLPYVESIASQRNGNGGEPFYTAIVHDKDDRGRPTRYLAVFCPTRDPETGAFTGILRSEDHQIGALAFVNDLTAVYNGDLRHHYKGDRLVRDWLPMLARAKFQDEIDRELAKADEHQARSDAHLDAGEIDQAEHEERTAIMYRQFAADAQAKLDTIK